MNTNDPYESNQQYKTTDQKPPIKKQKDELKDSNNPKDNNMQLTKIEEYTLSSHKKNLIFAMFLLSNLFLNYDTGVIPASLLEIIKEIDFDYKDQALLGSLVYLGLSFASLFVSLIFTTFRPSKVCSVVLVCNTCCCFIFSYSYYKPLLFITRFFMGVTEAFVVIYGPVWVNNYSPPKHSAKWMGILHSCSALGVILGYVIAGLVINFCKGYLTWRFAIQIQGIVQIFFALFFFFENDQYINVNLNQVQSDDNQNDSLNVSKVHDPSQKGSFYKGSQSQPQSSKNKEDNRIDAIEMSNLSKYFMQTKSVISNPLYLSITFGLCSIYFIVTGIQFWMTEYLIVILHVEPFIVIVVFSCISITAPLLGVLMGGIFADNYGGYKGKSTLKAIKLCCAFGFVSFVFAFPMGFLFSPIYLLTLLWAFLFFGAAIIPVGTGIMISTVRIDCQATSSSLSQLIFNLFGYFFAPILTGYIMDSFKDPSLGFIWGMRVVFWWVIFALLFMIISYIIVYHKFKKNASDHKDLIEEDMEENMGELMKREIRRQLALNSI